MPPKKRGRPSAKEKRQKIILGLFKNATKVHHIPQNIYDSIQRRRAANISNVVAPPDEEQMKSATGTKIYGRGRKARKYVDEVVNKEGAGAVEEMDYENFSESTIYHDTVIEQNFSDMNCTNDNELLNDRQLYQKAIKNSTQNWSYPYRSSTLENLRHYKISANLVETDTKHLRDIFVQGAEMEILRIDSLTKEARKRKDKLMQRIESEYEKMEKGKSHCLGEMIKELKNSYEGLLKKDDTEYLTKGHEATIGVPYSVRTIMKPQTEWIKKLHDKTTDRGLLNGCNGTSKRYKFAVFPIQG